MNSGTYILFPYGAIGQNVLKIPLTNPIPLPAINGSELFMDYLYVEYRQPTGRDAALGSLPEGTPTLAPIDINGLMVRGKIAGGITTYLLDMTPNSISSTPASDFLDSFLLSGQEFYVDNITIRAGDIAAGSAVVEVDVY